MVRDAAQAIALKRTAASAGTCLAIGWLLLALSGCGGGRARHAAAVRPASAATVRTAECQDWRAASEARRRALVAGLRSFFVQPLDSGAHERVPPDERAYRILTSYCRLRFARSFLIYRLYGNAAAFSGSR